MRYAAPWQTLFLSCEQAERVFTLLRIITKNLPKTQTLFLGLLCVENSHKFPSMRVKYLLDGMRVEETVEIEESEILERQNFENAMFFVQECCEEHFMQNVFPTLRISDEDDIKEKLKLMFNGNEK